MAKSAGKNEDLLWPSAVSVLIPAILCIGVLVYVAFYAAGYSLFQKVVVVIIAMIIIGVAEALFWMLWAAKKGFMQWPPSDKVKRWMMWQEEK